MKEDFLHYIWQFQYFDKASLCTTTGESLQVYHPGHPHINAGPDFAYARLKVGEIAWVGQVEIHVKASDWIKHQHQQDKAYDAVVLHVVWEEDQVICRQDGSVIPCLVLKGRVADRLRLRYDFLQGKKISQPQLSCASFLPKLSPIIRYTTLDKALLERLEHRAGEWLSLLDTQKGDWEQTAYQQLCRYLGGVINSQPFIQLSQQLPWKELRRFYSNPIQIEARVFGYSGFLAKPLIDEYQAILAKEYQWIHKQEELGASHFEWKWSRMRPSSFPTLRLAQLSGLVSHRLELTEVLSITDIEELKAWLNVPRSDYWQKHYHFGKVGKIRKSWPIDALAINWAIPFMYAYGKYKGNESLQERALSLLRQIPAESNRFLKIYSEADFQLESAADTQAALELWKHYCQPKKCLSCPIGTKAMMLE